MKKSLLTLVCTCLTFIALAQKADVTSLKQAELSRFKVMVAKDRAGLEAVMHRDLVYFHSSGVADNKDSYIASIFSGKSNYQSIDPVELVTRVYGKTGINTGIVNIVNLGADGKETPLKLRFTDVFVYEDGRWQMVSWQSTKLAN
ncbi:nuclear transport factor 2 family protein [Aquirufa sp. OSTEICH-129V]|uniref:Nuclear transport factor 2 family protein n=1 Tax=Aquirufa avitistagni TaxID=3104728 RepID=A0ABW6D8N8_9BACT